MPTQMYSVNQPLIATLLAWIRSGEIAIPEIQRPFVWDSTKVRDLIDSLYRGYPIGYIIAWKNPSVRLKDGTLSAGKKVLIDGQQRVTALMAAILGQPVVNTEYEKVRITIAFHPTEERFEVLNPAIQKDNAWIPDISRIFSGDIGLIRLVKQYREANPSADEEQVGKSLERLWGIPQKQIGLIELDADLDIETVTEIFIRINSKGVVLSQADFAMSKIAANESYGGSLLRKCIDYFCHLAVKPEFYSHLVENDKEFVQSEYLPQIAWLKNEKDDLYDPDYSDLLRVAFTSEFNRGRLADLVSLLSGRNFETRTFEEEIAARSFTQLKEGVRKFVNETNFKRFLMIVNSAGFIHPDLIRSQNALNFAYIVYLKLRSEGYHQGEIGGYVRKWLVLSLLTGRYSGSPETMFDLDIRNIREKKFPVYLANVEAAQLSDAFWTVGLVQQLETSSATSPVFNVYLAALCKSNTRGFLSKEIHVKELIGLKGDVHHVFPREYLKKNGLSKSQYNQVANYTYRQTEINVAIGSKAPHVYMAEVRKQCEGGPVKYGSIRDMDTLKENLAENDIPDDLFEMTADRYAEFLEKRRTLMARRMREYYASL